jgi:hypothetical protein
MDCCQSENFSLFAAVGVVCQIRMSCKKLKQRQFQKTKNNNDADHNLLPEADDQCLEL